VIDEMRGEAKQAVRLAAPSAKLDERRIAYMRYVGQGTEIVVPLANAPFGLDGAEALRRSFEEAYSKQYNRIVPGSAIELISFGVTVAAPMTFVDPVAADAPAHDAVPVSMACAFDPDRAAAIEVPMYRREDLRPGARIPGPALISEPQTTSVVSFRFDATINRFGHIELHRRNAATH
jgi:N-methylhydantoinase A